MSLRRLLPVLILLLVPWLAPAQVPVQKAKKAGAIPAAAPAAPAPAPGMPAPPLTLPSALPVNTSPGQVPLPGQAASETQLSDELLLRSAGLSSTGPALLDFFRKRAQSPAERTVIDDLVRQLGEDSAAARESAAGELVALGSVTLPALRRAAKELDDQVRAAGARRCLQVLEGDAAARLSAAAARLLAQRRPGGMIEVLLAYLPRAESSGVIDEVRGALVQTAFEDGKAAPPLVQALSDLVALRRVVAAEALCQGRTGPLPAEIFSLLQDARPLVRLRAALALAECRDARAVETLIALLSELPAAQAREADDYLSGLAGESAPALPPNADTAARQRHAEAWAAWWRGLDGAALVQEFRKRSLTDADREQALAAIKKLGDTAFNVREQAQAELSKMGAIIAPFVKQAANSPDQEVRQRAQRILRQIGDQPDPLREGVARLLTYRKPEGAVETLLTYLEFAEDAGVIEEVQDALLDLAVGESGPHPALVAALHDPLPLRRATAARALGWASPEYRGEVRKLLKDTEPSVRLSAALALASLRDREAVGTLIELLGLLPPDPAQPAEAFLKNLAGGHAPDVALAVDAAGRKKTHDAWDDWWRTRGAGVQLALATRTVLARGQLGYTLLVLHDRIMEIDGQRQVRWQHTGFQGVSEVQVLPGRRLLVAEMQMNRISERDLRTNEILWQKNVQWPVACQRLPNGNTFVATRNQLLEMDRDGKHVFTYDRPNHDILAAQRLRNGETIFLTANSECIRIDATGKELRSFPIGQPMQPSSLQVLPNGNVLVPHTYENKVVEYDPQGKNVWETPVPQRPTSAQRLRNGHTLIATMVPARVYELDRAGKTVWEYTTNGRITRALRR